MDSGDSSNRTVYSAPDFIGGGSTGVGDILSPEAEIRRNRATWQREHRRKIGNIHTKRYEKTVNGFLMRTYRNMQSRVTGVQQKKAHLYLGYDLLSRELFYAWSKSNENFISLFSVWEQSGYERKLTPSIDRLNSKLGYVLENLQWITHSENSKKGAISRHYG